MMGPVADDAAHEGGDASNAEAVDRESGIQDKAPLDDATGSTEPCGPDSDCPPMRELGLRRGDLVADAYRVLRALGAGGMGVVTLARDERLDRLVAIKFIRPALIARDDLRSFFLTEARAMARVTHPNVLTVHAFGEHDRIPYFVMEFVDGPTVDEWLVRSRRDGRFDVDAALDVIEQACQGVDAIHGARTVHRDLKPSNLLMSASEACEGTRRVAVSDLGVARILAGGEGTDPSCIVGSAAYMAPEAALGDEVDVALATRRDVYALGCVAYEVLTGRLPFEAQNDVGLMAKHLLEVPAPPSSAAPDLGTQFDEVLLRALDKSPHQRWPSAGALGRALLEARRQAEGPTRILIVDDDPDWRTLLHRALAPRFPDAQIDCVGDGAEAMAAFEETVYSVVLVDLAMPSMDGMELTSHMRASDATKQTPIIVMTAAGGPREWRRLSGMGADAFLVKPVEPEDVAMLIRRTMRSRRRAHR